MPIRTSVILVILTTIACITQAQTPTWSGNVARIVYTKCTPCHRQGEIAPFDLITYADAKIRANTIKAVTQSRYMPPWKPLPGHADYLGDRSLSAEEQAVITAWVDGGSPEGDPAQTPPPPTFPTGSQLGTPDLVLEMSESWSVVDNNTDVYRYFVLPTNLLQDQNIRALEFRPGNAAVVHHVLYYLDTTGTARRKDEEDKLAGYSGFGDPGFTSAASYLGWVPGAQSRFFPPNIGARLLKNSDLVIQVHYAPSFLPATDKSHVNVFFDDDPQIRVVNEFSLGPLNLDGELFLIPANQSKRFVAKYKIPLDVSLMGVAPHMHLLGRECRAYAVTPKGDTIKLVGVNDWDFNWQGGYTFRHLIRVPRNSTLYYEATYDNTTGNSLNPNSPPKLVGWGEKTTDEMILCYFHWLPYQAGDELIELETNPVLSVESDLKTDFRFVFSPNPAFDESHITFDLSQPQRISLDVVDAMGQSVYVLKKNSPFERGQHSIPYSVAHLANGAYFVRMESSRGLVSIPFVVAR
ncbi:MAG: T9SS type A sorting domain-containing protein [bacterium]|nr:T9SS type A sorting domain-containing protein [bacterium]